MNNHMLASITARDAQHALFFFDSEEGYDGGHFIRALHKTCSYADDHNLKRLADAFPGPVAAWQLGSRIPGGIKMLREIAGR